MTTGAELWLTAPPQTGDIALSRESKVSHSSTIAQGEGATHTHGEPHTLPSMGHGLFSFSTQITTHMHCVPVRPLASPRGLA